MESRSMFAVIKKVTPNMWYHITDDEGETAYFKYYMETEQHGMVDIKLIVKEQVVSMRVHLREISESDYKFIILENQDTIDLLYEK